MKQDTPILTPDGLRKTLQVNNSFFETHTKKNFGREDINGSQFSGTVENFGFEMLLESRKHKLEKPSLKNLFVDNKMDYYFDIQYSKMIETYDQQGLLEAVLKKDVFLSNKIYQLRFDDCHTEYVPRSEIWGGYDDSNPESYVFKDIFSSTSTPPTLVITDANDPTIIEEVSLSLSVAEGFDTKYYFYRGIGTTDFIDSYVGGTLLTKPITDVQNGLAWIWMTVDIFRLLPDVSFIGNVLSGATKPQLIIGTDGHAISHIYPYIYGNQSLPYPIDSGTWKLIAYSETDGFSERSESNFSSEVSSIALSYDNDDDDIHNVYDITFAEDYIKITLSDAVEWKFVRNSINEPYHAEVSMTSFIPNDTASHGVVLVDAFNISFSDMYLHPYEGICGSAQSGVHVDTLSDYVDNAVPKTNGTIHGLGEFDGLPSYFKTMKGRTTHRSHVELYTIRDQVNLYTQQPTRKQTAGLIFDSAMPQEELYDLAMNDPAIYYQPDPNNYLYLTDMDKVVSQKNVLSEITFNDENTFGNCKRISDIKKPKFIYHGNRTFSLNYIYLDPETQYARVYYVNNDPSKYENNAGLSSDERKPPRTLARICDIPTDYTQLMHIANNAATFLFDDKYVRMTCPFGSDDLETLLNNRTLAFVRPPDNHGPGDKWIFTLNESPNAILNKQTLIGMGYCKWEIPSSYIDADDLSYIISNGGSDYEEDDEFYVLIGGQAFDGVVTSVSPTGQVLSVSIDLSDEQVSVYNLDGVDTTIAAINKSSNGEGLTFVFSVLSSDVIDEHLPYPLINAAGTDGTPPDETLFCFKLDKYRNIWIWTMDDTWTWSQYCQVTGVEVIDNPYDRNPTIDERVVDDVLLVDVMYAQPEINVSGTGAYELYPDMFKNVDIQRYITYLWNVYPSNPEEDLSERINDKNKQGMFYELICTDPASGYFDLVTYETGLPWNADRSDVTNPVTLPQFNQLNLPSYSNKTNKLMYNFTDHQPEMFLYSPKKNTIETFDIHFSARDLNVIDEQRPITWKDLSSSLYDANRKLYNNVYYYPEFEHTEAYVNFYHSLTSLSRTEILTLILDTFGEQAEPLLVEDSSYRYTHQKLIEYVTQRFPLDKPEYVKDDIKIIRYAGDEVMYSNGLPKGEQPSGGFVSLTSETLNPKVSADGIDRTSFFEYIFKIDDINFSGFNSNMRIHDDDGKDITPYSIIIWNGKKYVYNVNEWVELL